MTNVVKLAPAQNKHHSSIVLTTHDAETRVQIRIPLENLEQAEVGLTLLAAAVEQSLRAIATARRSRTPETAGDAVLTFVRACLSKTSRMLNAKRPRRAPLNTP